jgi:hypothetical protein
MRWSSWYLAVLVNSTMEPKQMTASAFSGAVGDHDSIEVLWEDTERVFCRLERGDAASIGMLSYTSFPVLSIRRSRASVVSRTNTNFKDYLDSAWALRPLELVRERGQTMLVVDYTGGEPLDRLVPASRWRSGSSSDSQGAVRRSVSSTDAG